MRARWLVVLMCAYALALVLIALWSSPVDRGVDVTNLGPVSWLIRTLGITPQEGYRLTEFTANIALFAPFGVFAMLLRPSWHWWQATLAAAATSATIELLQDALRPERVGAVSDVVANTVGGAIGALLCVAARSGTELLRDHRNA